MVTAFERTSIQERFTNGLEHPKQNRYTYKSRTLRNMCFNYHKWIQVIMVDIFSFFAELDYMYLHNMLFWSSNISGGGCEKPPTFLLKWGKISVLAFWGPTLSRLNFHQHWVNSANFYPFPQKMEYPLYDITVTDSAN